MCKTKRKTDALEPKPITATATATNTDPSFPSTTRTDSTHLITDSTHPNSSTTFNSSSTRSSLRLSLSLSQNPNIYSFSEISSATQNFLSNRPSSSSSSWRCSLRGSDTVIVRRKFLRPINPPELRHLLLHICKSHHTSIIPLLGAALSDYQIYLVYDHAKGLNLSDCLRNPKNPGFTALSTWISRMQVAIDVAQGLEYIHHYTGLDLHLLHNRIDSSSIIVTEPDFHAKICYFGAAVLAGEISDISDTRTKLERLGSKAWKVEGTRGYMPTDGIVSQKSDVFAFGILILELLSGEEPLRYRYDEKMRDRYERVSVTDRAREAMESGKVRQWIDSRLRDSFPVGVAEMMTRVALDCVHVEADQRPDMKRVAGKISKLYLESKAWSEGMVVPDITVSFALR